MLQSYTVTVRKVVTITYESTINIAARSEKEAVQIACEAAGEPGNEVHTKTAGWRKLRVVKS